MNSSWIARLKLLVVPVALVISGGFVAHASTAAFSSTTQNAANSWTAGTVSLSDDDSGSAMFNATGLTPSSTGSRCIAVTYNGNVASTVSLYGTATGNLAPYVNLTVETGTGRTFSDGDPCAALTSPTTIYSGTLANFASTSSTFASGVPAAATRWAPSTAGTVRVYRFSYSIANDNNAQGQSANATFTWEAQSV